MEYKEKDREAINRLKIKDQRLKIVEIPFSKYKKYLPLLYSHFIFSYIVRRQSLDVFFAPANTLPIFYNGKSVVTVHDLAIYRHPEWFPSGQIFSTKFLFPHSLRKANKIMAVSQATKKDIVEIFKIDPQKIEVVYEGVDLEKFKPAEDKNAVCTDVGRRYIITKPYVLFLGTLEPRKNLVRLIQAFTNSRELVNGYQLVIAGGKGWHYNQIFEEAKRVQTSTQRGRISKNPRDPTPGMGTSETPEIIFTGYVSDKDKVKLLQAAEVFVFPSLYEGFGLPVLESLACGTPVVCANTSSLPEVGGDVPVYVDPLEVAAISSGLSQVLNSETEKQRQRQAGPIQAQKFSWQGAAAQIREVLSS